MEEKGNHKNRRGFTPAAKLLVILISAVIAVVGLVLLSGVCGLRYLTVDRADGSEVRFIGFVDGEGLPLNGTAYFSDGTSARVTERGKRTKYSDGSVYEGALTDEFRRTGKGTLEYANGDRYLGDFADDELTGHGQIQYAGGDSYTGDFVRGELTGAGRYVFTSGDVYNGELINGKKEGRGTYTFINGDVYEGTFRSDLRDGTGKMTFADGSSYSGGYLAGLKHGSGIYIYANGDSYTGEFYRDMRQGRGTYTWANGESYTGDFFANRIDGYGIYTWVEEGRASYEGYFEAGTIKIVEN